MTHEKFEKLKNCLSIPSMKTFWITDGRAVNDKHFIAYREITNVSDSYQDEGPVAWLSDNTGEYIALDNVDDTEIVFFTKVE